MAPHNVFEVVMEYSVYLLPMTPCVDMYLLIHTLTTFLRSLLAIAYIKVEEYTGAYESDKLHPPFLRLNR